MEKFIYNGFEFFKEDSFNHGKPYSQVFVNLPKSFKHKGGTIEVAYAYSSLNPITWIINRQHLTLLTDYFGGAFNNSIGALSETCPTASAVKYQGETFFGFPSYSELVDYLTGCWLQTL